MKNKYKVTFKPMNVSIHVPEGESLLRAAILANVHINASCGGNGTCGKCKVILESGKINNITVMNLSQEEIKDGYYLACKVIVKDDIIVNIPIESQLGDKKVLIKDSKGIHRQPTQILSPEIIEDICKPDPIGKKYFLELAEPTLEDNISDIQRIIRELKNRYDIQEKDILVNNKVLRQIPYVLREARFKITVTLLNYKDKVILSRIEPGDTTHMQYALCIDVGTTSVYALLIDVTNGKILTEASDYNAQLTCGEDVITRIVFAQRKDGLSKLQGLIGETISNLANVVVDKCGITLEDISYLVVAGNTTMIHLLLGIPPQYIRETPYVPVSNTFPPTMVEELGININSHAYIYIIPSVASYLGGDIISGLIACSFTTRKEVCLYIDIGTNGEMVLGCGDWMVACSCSAGPALEGGTIKFGIRATEGAIEEVRINPLTYEPMILTIGQKKPIGICGSGLIDTVAELFECGIIDQQGKFYTHLNTEYIRRGESGFEYVLAFAENTDIGKDIVLTETDIEDLIRAKSAAYAGIKILLQNVGLTFDDIKYIIISGNFGTYVDIQKSITIGLFPEVPKDKFVFIGNGSLLGTRVCAMSKDMMETAERIANSITNFELSENKDFMDEFIKGLFLPYTDANEFKGVMDRIAISQRFGR
jgi:uncharacterized 2Fe-2S/4Fe-4S cluster protein (DUF4445 family)